MFFYVVLCSYICFNTYCSKSYLRQQNNEVQRYEMPVYRYTLTDITDILVPLHADSSDRF